MVPGSSAASAEAGTARKHADVSLEHPTPAATLSPGGTNAVPVASPVASETMKSK